MENRSFDHILGAIPNVDGVDPDNPARNLERPGSSVSYVQTPNAVRKLKPDPRHETKHVLLRQIEGEGMGRMGGFVYDFAVSEPDSEEAWPQVMSYFGLDSLPAIHTLAKNFTVCDAWFSSVPGPTWTNRFFALSGTSQGYVEMPKLPYFQYFHKYDQTTIFDRLNEKTVPWRVYAGDVPLSLLFYNQRKKENLQRYRRMNSFYEDVSNTDVSKIPSFIFIEPSYLPFGQNDQHPPHDVLKGDDLVASVYNAIRSNDSLWNSALFIVLWDEHGGFYDHVYPPKAEPPDHHTQEYTFDRYGVRVPALLVSKWVKQGVYRPQSGVLDHTSVLRYLQDKYQLGGLGNRVASAASIAAALVDQANLAPPLQNLGVGKPAMTSIYEEREPELNANQAAIIEFTKTLEVEMGATPQEIGTRSMRARMSVQGEIEVAKERAWLFIDRQSQ
jgi:phospholipase C